MVRLRGQPRRWALTRRASLSLRPTHAQHRAACPLACESCCRRQCTRRGPSLHPHLPSGSPSGGHCVLSVGPLPRPAKRPQTHAGKADSLLGISTLSLTFLSPVCQGVTRGQAPEGAFGQLTCSSQTFCLLFLLPSVDGRQDFPGLPSPPAPLPPSFPSSFQTPSHTPQDVFVSEHISQIPYTLVSFLGIL